MEYINRTYDKEISRIYFSYIVYCLYTIHEKYLTNDRILMIKKMIESEYIKFEDLEITELFGITYSSNIIQEILVMNKLKKENYTWITKRKEAEKYRNFIAGYAPFEIVQSYIKYHKFEKEDLILCSLQHKQSKIIFRSFDEKKRDEICPMWRDHII
jgi:hypothetical protein